MVDDPIAYLLKHKARTSYVQVKNRADGKLVDICSGKIRLDFERTKSGAGSWVGRG